MRGGSDGGARSTCVRDITGFEGVDVDGPDNPETDVEVLDIGLVEPELSPLSFSIMVRC